jgi:hypothetical protein
LQSKGACFASATKAALYFSLLYLFFNVNVVKRLEKNKVEIVANEKKAKLVFLKSF